MTDKAKDSTKRIERPPSRRWVESEEIDDNVKNPSGIFTIMSSNVLSARYTTGEPVQGYNGQFFQAGEIHNRAKYGYCPDEYLDWEYRKNLLIREIQATNPDVACLQEVEANQFQTFFKKKLSKLGYKGIYYERSAGDRKRDKEEASKVDGCAIFYKSNKLTLVSQTPVDFNASMHNTDEWEDTSVGKLCGGKDNCSEDETNEFAFEMFRLMTTQGSVALCAMFRTTYSFWPNDDVPEVDQGRHRHLLVCNAHLESKFTLPDVRIVQAMSLVKHARKITRDYYDSQVVICGDLNALPNSGCLRYLTEGRISLKDPDFYNMPYEKILSKMFGKPNEEGCYTHNLGLTTAIPSNIMPYSCLQPKFKGMLDHILYEKDKFHLSESLKGPVDETWLKKHQIKGAPSQHLPSDHFPLAAKLVMKKDTLANDGCAEETHAKITFQVVDFPEDIENEFSDHEEIDI